MKRMKIIATHAGLVAMLFTFLSFNSASALAHSRREAHPAVDLIQGLQNLLPESFESWKSSELANVSGILGGDMPQKLAKA